MKAIRLIKENKILFLILAFAAVLRFYHIDYQSIWLDEIHTMNEANPKVGFSDLYGIIMAGEQMPPIYFYSLYFLFKIFGYTTLVARLYSAIIGIVSVYSVYLLGKEMMNRKVGIIAALLVTVNPFQLYYSQEARPYIFLFLFTTLAFCYLVRFLKLPNRKNALYYGLFSGLMLCSHFFGLFVLFAQYLLLLAFLILSDKQDRKKFFLNVFLSGMVILVLSLPAIRIFIKVTQIKEFWIKAPTLDVYTLIFREFFGNAEMVLALIGFVVLFYFIKLAKEKDTPITYDAVVSNKMIFSFMVLIPTSVIILLVPLIRSYLAVPMIISRYFITILPLIIVLISIAVYQFQNRLIQYSILALFVILSLTDITVVKKYYTNVSKAQFREATNFVIANNKDHEPVVSSLGWYMPYFLKNDKVNFEIVDKYLDAYIAEMQQDPAKIKPFWFTDCRDYTASEATQKFIDDNFYVDNNYDGFQAWSKHFILLKDVPQTVDISKFKNLQQYNGDTFMLNVESFENANNKLTTAGWAYFEGQDAFKTQLSPILIKDGKATRLLSQKVIRNDVTTYFKNPFNVDDCGFKATYDLNKLEPGKYQFAVYLFNKETKKEGLVLTDKFIEK